VIGGLDIFARQEFPNTGTNCRTPAEILKSPYFFPYKTNSYREFRIGTVLALTWVEMNFLSPNGTGI
jgi:hypothetical protein